MNRLKFLRNEKGESLEKVAKYLNVTIQTISNYENEKRDMSPDTILKLSDYFGVSIDFLLGKSDVRNPEKIVNDEDVKIVADSGILGLNDYNRQVAIDIIKGLKAKQDIDEKNKKD